jgi:HTH-type transcriptional regulator/antitoxin HigA
MQLKPIKNKADYEAALEEIERLWGAEEGSADGDRLEILATLVEAYEEKHFPMDSRTRINLRLCNDENTLN